MYCNSSDFIREYIFPGGHLPCLGAVVEACRGTGLQLRDTHDIGPDYAITLRQWREVWEAKREDVLRLGYSDRFWRKYRCAPGWSAAGGSRGRHCVCGGGRGGGAMRCTAVLPEP